MAKTGLPNVAATDADSAPMGARLRQRRTSLGLTMSHVAEGAGLSIGFISQLERGLTSPSLSSLVALAGVLEMPVASLLEQPAGDAPVTRHASRPTYAIDPGSVRYERLSVALPGGSLRAVIVHEPPGWRAEPISHTGEELIYLLSGALTVEVDGERSVLGPGDSIHFLSTRTHATWNHGDSDAVLLWCGTMDVFGEGEAPDPIHRNRETAGKAAPKAPTGET